MLFSSHRDGSPKTMSVCVLSVVTLRTPQVTQVLIYPNPTTPYATPETLHPQPETRNRTP